MQGKPKNPPDLGTAVVAAFHELYAQTRTPKGMEEFKWEALRAKPYHLMKKYYDVDKKQPLKPVDRDAFEALKSYLPKDFKPGHSITEDVFKKHLDRYISHEKDNFCAATFGYLVNKVAPGSMMKTMYVDDALIKMFSKAKALRTLDDPPPPRAGDVYFRIKDTAPKDALKVINGQLFMNGKPIQAEAATGGLSNIARHMALIAGPPEGDLIPTHNANRNGNRLLEPNLLIPKGEVWLVGKTDDFARHFGIEPTAAAKTTARTQDKPAQRQAGLRPE